MQTLDVISVNIWDIISSLLNLVILFLLVKKFLYKPVKNILAKRESEINAHYDKARLAEESALDSRREWEEKLSGADAEANAILTSAAETARRRGEAIITDAEEKASGIIRVAKSEAELEHKKALDGIKKEIVDLSGALAEKLISREINTEDHRSLIDSFIDDIGDDND